VVTAGEAGRQLRYLRSVIAFSRPETHLSLYLGVSKIRTKVSKIRTKIKTKLKTILVKNLVSYREKVLALEYGAQFLNDLD
jgi:hypothetical protein